MTGPLIVEDSLRIEDLVAALVQLAPVDESHCWRHGDAQGIRRLTGRRIVPEQIELDLTACDEAPLRFGRSLHRWDWQARIAQAHWRHGRLIVAYDLELC